VFLEINAERIIAYGRIADIARLGGGVAKTVLGMTNLFRSGEARRCVEKSWSKEPAERRRIKRDFLLRRPIRSQEVNVKRKSVGLLRSKWRRRRREEDAMNRAPTGRKARNRETKNKEKGEEGTTCLAPTADAGIVRTTRAGQARPYKGGDGGESGNFLGFEGLGAGVEG